MTRARMTRAGLTRRSAVAVAMVLVATLAVAGGVVAWQRPGEFVVAGGCRMLLAPEQPVSLPDPIVADLGDPDLGVAREDLSSPAEALVVAARRAAVEDAHRKEVPPADYYACGIDGSDELVLLRRRELGAELCYGEPCDDEHPEVRTCVLVYPAPSGGWPRLEDCPDLTPG